MQILAVSALPVYLPYDKAPVPFGDPFSGITATAAAPGVITSVGYNPVIGDAVAFSFTAGGSLPAPLVVGTKYFVVSVTNQTFTLSATKGGAAITTTTTGSLITLHLLSNQPDGTLAPFKSGASVVVMNLTATAGVTLQVAPDLNAAGQYGNPGGPGTFVTIATLAATSAQVVVLSGDWLKASSALVLMQN